MSEAGEASLPDRIRTCLVTSITDGMFAPRHFFQNWFRGNGSAYFFLFQKNLSVTNIQVAELLALLRSYTTRTDTGRAVRDLQFLSVQEFNSSVQSIVESYVSSHLAGDTLKHIGSLYTDLLRNIVVIDLYFGSCAVFMPHNLSLDHRSVCAFSGFIHSCGPSLLNRNISKATKGEFFEKLEAFLQSRSDLQAPVQFIVYAHEDYTPHDRRLSSELRRGLDEVKVFLDKYYVGNESLVSVLKDLRKQFAGRLDVPEHDHYKKLLEDAETVNNMPGSISTIWLLVDRRPGPELRNPSDRQYFLCYFQEFRNENSLLIFDENKPAWIDHTTLPHSLTAAMINVTRPWWSSPEVTIGDLFAGTGTTLLECLKHGAHIFGTDTCPIVQTMVMDNLSFFSMEPQDLENLCLALEEAESIHPAERLKEGMKTFDIQRKKTSTTEAYFWALDIFQQICPDPHSSDIVLTAEHAEAINAKGFDQRIFLYLALRTHRRNFASLEREESDWYGAYKKQSADLREQIRRLIRLRQRQARGRELPGKVIVFPGWYSESCGLEPSAFRALVSEKSLGICVFEKDARKFPPNSCDVIVTDPPYGFNTRTNPEELGELYRDVIGVMLRALKGEGQIMIALPDWSYTGRQVPHFVTKQIVTHQLLAAAEREGLEVFQEAYSVPYPGQSLRAPYYWESERALRRAILHFRVRNPKPRQALPTI
ncbi:MAG TPA: hypothetical protein VKV95_09890 [Terriglobia bacterium]|nr:hypothetical protein [Terriglobia bacterium]